MHNKTYRNLVLILISVLFIPIIFFFVACKNKNNQNLNPNNVDIFQEIADYIQKNGKKTTLTHFEGNEDEIFTIKHTNQENSFDYYPERDMLSIYGHTSDLPGIFFTIYIPHVKDYSTIDYLADGAMASMWPFKLTIPNTPRGFKESKKAQEGHRTIYKYDLFSYDDVNKKDAASTNLAKAMTANLQTFSSYFQDKTSILNIENSLLYYFHLPVSISFQVN